VTAQVRELPSTIVTRRLSTLQAPWLGLVVRLVVGGVWVAAGVVKLPHPADSVAAVRAYQALPPDLVAPVGQLLPVVEVVIGVMLILGLLTRGAAALSALLLVGFLIGIISVWARDIDIDCGCFGGGGLDLDAKSKYPWEIARDTALLVASLWLVRLRRSRLAFDNRLFTPVQTLQES
jgi:uncharacterized membrane protein YphA (DoxX/SURF4 family)